MAIPSIPQNFYVQTGNRQVYLSWDIAAGATTYSIERSTDGVNYSSLATPLVPNYLDTTVTTGIQYYYKVASTNVDGTSSYTSPQSVVPTPTAEMSLGQLRLLAQQKADMVNSNFITVPEWNVYINQSMFELYDLLVAADEDYFIATPAQFQVNPIGTQTYLYPLPDGNTTFINGIDNTSSYVAPPFYKMKGVDLGLSAANNAWVSIRKFNFSNRNKWVYPNSYSTIYGIFNLQYRVIGNSIEFIPIPSNGQNIRLWYVPRLTQLLADTDTTSSGISGWLEYVVVDAAIKALQKQQRDASILIMQKEALKSRIESMAVNRDAQPDTVTDIRRRGWGGSYGNSSDDFGPIGGFAILPLSLGFPNFISEDLANKYLTHSIHSSNILLTYSTIGVFAAYFIYLLLSKFSGRISFSWTRNLITVSSTSFISHIKKIVFGSTKKQMIRVHAPRVITSMTNKKTVGKNSLMHFPRMSMRPNLFSLSAARLPQTEYTISGVVPFSYPLPTFVKTFFINLRPKAFFNSLFHKITILFRLIGVK